LPVPAVVSLSHSLTKAHAGRQSCERIHIVPKAYYTILIVREFAVQPFTEDDLDQLERAIPPAVAAGAAATGLTETGPGHAFVKSLAGIHAYSKAVLARGGLMDFRLAVAHGRPLRVPYLELQYYSPVETAGMAAGQLAVAKLLTVWYGLTASHFRRMPPIGRAADYLAMQVPGVQETVCDLPKELGITNFTARDIYLEVRFNATDLLSQQTSPQECLTALDPFIDFPLAPINAVVPPSAP
jgi:hypothetical protein